MHVESGGSRRIEKTRGANRADAAGRPIEWRDVLGCLPTDETRSYVTGRLREAGFSVDSFKRVRGARETVADALTRIEDRGELSGTRRDALKSVRRRLEWELWS